MRSIREYIRKTLFDSSSILPAYRHDAPQRVKDFAFVRAPVERLADVLSRGFVLPDKERVAQACGRVEIRRVPLAFGAQCFVWTTPLHCAAGGYNLSFRYEPHEPHEPHAPHEPHEPRLLGYIIGGLHVFIG